MSKGLLQRWTDAQEAENKSSVQARDEKDNQLYRLCRRLRCWGGGGHWGGEAARGRRQAWVARSCRRSMIVRCAVADRR